nr:Chain B, Epstein-Barr nuclear antigen 2 [Human herpesvirus 4 strain B95-8]
DLDESWDYIFETT